MRMPTISQGWRGGETPPATLHLGKFSTIHRLSRSFVTDATPKTRLGKVSDFKEKSLITGLFSNTSGSKKNCYTLLHYAFSSPFLAKSVVGCSRGVVGFFCNCKYMILIECGKLYSFILNILIRNLLKA